MLKSVEYNIEKNAGDSVGKDLDSLFFITIPVYLQRVYCLAQGSSSDWSHYNEITKLYLNTKYLSSDGILWSWISNHFILLNLSAQLLDFRPFGLVRIIRGEIFIFFLFHKNKQ